MVGQRARRAAPETQPCCIYVKKGCSTAQTTITRNAATSPAIQPSSLELSISSGVPTSLPLISIPNYPHVLSHWTHTAILPDPKRWGFPGMDEGCQQLGGRAEAPCIHRLVATGWCATTSTNAHQCSPMSSVGSCCLTSPPSWKLGLISSFCAWTTSL